LYQAAVAGATALGGSGAGGFLRHGGAADSGGRHAGAGAARGGDAVAGGLWAARRRAGAGRAFGRLGGDAPSLAAASAAAIDGAEGSDGITAALSDALDAGFTTAPI
jgi:hypothetical protein